jgi:hypothetical protein
MRAKDVRECVGVVAAHPALAHRYGKTLNDLRTVWLGLLGREAFRSVVFEDSQPPRTTVIGVGVSAFVSDEFVRSLKTPPFVWLGPELIRRISRGESPLLANRAVREANTNGGLNLAVWEGAGRPEYRKCAELHAGLVSAFLEQHRGFLLKEAIGPASSREVLDVTLRTGTQIVNENGLYTDSPGRSLDEVFRMPHYLGLTREVALSRIGAWMGSLFLYQIPRCGFRPSEQRLLLASLRGGTDKELADDLGISLATVKKHWLSIYSRVSTRLPSLFPNRVAMREEAGRGREKKQHIIEYVREHPEELRPASP